ncbi:MAG: small multi-drug export protein [Clostridia bacterium]|nr:small multi-drug export protein [Clostridia bacterium]
MKEAVQNFFVNLPIPTWLKIMLSAMIPMVEARYSILFFMDSGVPYWELYALSVLGNMIPVPFIIYLFRPLLAFLRRTKLFRKVAVKLEERTHKKAAQLQKYSAWGLFFFVALPVPGTGAITGSMIAALLDMREKYALPAILIGTMVATFITTGAMGFLQWVVSLF